MRVHLSCGRICVKYATAARQWGSIEGKEKPGHQTCNSKSDSELGMVFSINGDFHTASISTYYHNPVGFWRDPFPAHGSSKAKSKILDLQ